MSSLGEEFPREQARLRELLVQYRSMGSAGAFGAAFIEQTLKHADRAVMENDLPAMIWLYQEMKEYKS